MKVLLIEDKYQIRETISFCLQLRWPGTEILNSHDGKNGINMLKSGHFDFLLLDFDMPDQYGLSLLNEIRSFSDIPIIILAFQNEEEQVLSLEMGADDYITKPLRPRELVARCNAVLRRYTASQLSR